MIKKSEKFKIKIIFKMLIVILMVLYFLILTCQICFVIYGNIKKNEELKSLNQKLHNEIEINNKLKEQIEIGLTEDYVQTKARNDLNMVMPFERVFFNVSNG